MSTPAPLPGGFDLMAGAKGLTYLTQPQAAFLLPGTTSDALLVAIKPDVLLTHELRLYALDGTLLASSTLPTGVGQGLFGNVEAVAFDGASNRLFLGDESSVNSQIAVATLVPEPRTLAMLAMAPAFVTRRRRA